MTTDRNSDALARLRAAAPEAGDVDLAALRRAVDERRADQGALGAGAPEQPADELAARRRRGMTGTGWAAAAAAAVIFGGGGLLAGSAGLGDGPFDAAPASDTEESYDTAGEDAAEPEAEVFADRSGDGDTSADQDGEVTAGSDGAAGEEEESAPLLEDSESASELRFLASGLPSGPGVAPVWELQDAELGESEADLELVPLGEVEVITPDESAVMLNDPAMFSLIDPVPPGPPGTQAPGGILTIVEAELTWQTYENAAGSLLVVPAYHLTDSEDQSWKVVAVADLSEIE